MFCVCQYAAEVVENDKRPNDEVANCCQPPPAYEPRRIPAAVGFDMPVPPPAAVNIPEVVALNVNEPLVLVM